MSEEPQIGAPKLETFLYRLDVSDYIAKEYIPYVYDVMRLLTIQIIYHLMYFVSNPRAVSENFGNILESILYICLGISAYWLIVRKAFVIVP